MDLETLSAKVKSRFATPKTVIFPEGDNQEIQQAARILQDQNLVRPILIGQNVTPDLHHIDGTDYLNEFAQEFCTKKPKYDHAEASKMLAKSINYAAAYLHAHHADAMVAGIDHPTSDVIRASLHFVGTAPSTKTASSLFMMDIPNRDAPLFFADCAFNAFPDAQMLCDIAIASAASAKTLTGEDSKVAFLAFSSHGSAQHENLQKIIDATAFAKEKCPDLAIDGEIQADAALMPDLAAKKLGADNALQGRANVLIFPDLNSGNIAYKLVQYLANARAIGPMLQGFSQPVCDLSRGANAQDVAASTLLTLLMYLQE